MLEKSLRRENATGTWIKLGNGEKWCISPLPLGKKCKPILDKLEALLEKQEAFMAQVKSDGAKEKDNVHSLGEVMEKASVLVFEVLSVNYPKLTQDQFDDLALVTIKHIPEIVSIVKGERELEELVPHDEGEAQSRKTSA